jgi:hypothetical protein
MAQDRQHQTTTGQAHDTAPAAQPEVVEGPGIKRLRELFAKGTPSPKDVVAILDAHRGERAQILEFLHGHAGNAYVASVMEAAEKLRLDLERRELVAGDPSSPDGGFFLASQAENGARWRTGDGTFAGQIGKQGVDARYNLDADSSLHLRSDNRHKETTLAYEENGQNLGELAGRYRSSDDWNLGVRRPIALGEGGGMLLPELRHQVRPEAGGADVAALGYRLGESVTADAYLGRASDGGLAAGASGDYRFGRGGVGGSIDHSPEATRFGLGGHYRLNDETTLSGAISHVDRRHGLDSTAVGVSERYRSPNLVHGLDLSYENSDKERVHMGGFVDAQVGRNLYAGAWGGYDKVEGEQPWGRAGASLTFTPDEKLALTVAGVLDNEGNFETRLQLDVFKKRVEGVRTISESKRNAIVSVFLSYTQGNRHDLFDERYGTPTFRRDTPGGEGGTFGAGIRIRF